MQWQADNNSSSSSSLATYIIIKREERTFGSTVQYLVHTIRERSRQQEISLVQILLWGTIMCSN